MRSKVFFELNGKRYKLIHRDKRYLESLGCKKCCFYTKINTCKRPWPIVCSPLCYWVQVTDPIQGNSTQRGKRK